MAIKNIVKIILGILLTIILGAVGSGVWEKILSPLLSYLSGSFTILISSLSSSYSDSIYLNASTVRYDGEAAIVILLILLIVFYLLFYVSLQSKINNKFILLCHSVLSMYSKGWSGIIFSGTILVFLIFTISKQSSTFYVRKYSVKQMDILRPCIGDNSYYALYSDYLQIKNKKDFENFLTSIDSYSKECEINLDKFSLQ